MYGPLSFVAIMATALMAGMGHALLFLYRAVLDLDLPCLEGIVRAKRPQRLPVVLTREEVRAVLHPLTGMSRRDRLTEIG